MRAALRTSFITGLTFVIALTLCFPIIWTIFTGLKHETDALTIPPTVVVPLTFSHYLNVITSGYGHYLENTLIAVFGSILASFALGLPAAYKLAFFPGRRANDLLFFALSTRFLPGVAVIVPIFLLCVKVGLIDSLWGLIAIYTSLNIPIVLWLMRSFFKDVPYELVEAAIMEGTPHRWIMLEIVLPLSKAGLATTGFLLLIMTWNEFFFAVNLTSESAATLPVYMASFLTSKGQSWALMSSAAVLAVVPMLLAGYLASRALARGALSGAVK